MSLTFFACTVIQKPFLLLATVGYTFFVSRLIWSRKWPARLAQTILSHYIGSLTDWGKAGAATGGVGPGIFWAILTLPIRQEPLSSFADIGPTLSPDLCSSVPSTILANSMVLRQKERNLNICACDDIAVLPIIG